MANVIQQLNLKRENQRFFINTTEIPGVQNIRGEYELNLSPATYLSATNVPLVPKGGQVGSFFVVTQLISDDFLLPFTGNSGFNGYILRSRETVANNFSFQSGYLTSYNSKYTLGQLPEISAGISVLGTIGQLPSSDPIVRSDFVTIYGGSSTNLLKIPGPGCFNLNIGDFQTNRVLSYDISITTNRLPAYDLGNPYPVEVQISYPIEVTCGFQIDLNDYQTRNSRAFPNNVRTDNLALSISDFKTHQAITSYSFNGLTLFQESYSMAVDGSPTVNLLYKKFVNG